MKEPRKIDFQRCLSGVEFEGWVVDLLTQLSFPANRVGKNDCGVDIIAEANWQGKKYRFYIQCKYQNKPVGKTPVHEIFAGTAHCKEYGRPVVITNNEATFVVNMRGAQTFYGPIPLRALSYMPRPVTT